MLSAQANNKVFTIVEAARLLGVSAETLRRWNRQGRIIIGENPAGKKILTHEDINALRKPVRTPKTFSSQSIYTATPKSSVKDSYSPSAKILISTLILLIFFLSFAALYLTWNYSPFPQTLSERIASIEAGLKDKASGLLVNLVEEGVKNKVSVGEQVLLSEIPQDLSINSLSLSSDLKVGGDASIEGTLTVSSESNLYSLNVNNNLNVTGDSLLTGSLNVGGTINGSTLSSTALTFTGTSASIYPSSSDTSLFLNGGTTGTVNIGNSSTGDIHIGGGTQSSGCTITNNNGSLNCSSDITSSGNLRVNGGTLSTTQTTLSIDVADSGSINFRDSSNTLVSITDEGTTGNINVTGIYKIGGTTGKTIATCGSSQYLGGIAITGGIVTTLGNCNDVSSTTGTDLTLSGDLAVNGGDITSTSSTFNLLNQPTTLNIGSTNVTRAVNIGTGTNADTINIGTGTGTADTINIGGISGTTVNITGGTVNITGNLVSTGTVQGTRLISTIATGTAPLTVASTTVVPNLNASLLEGNSASTVMSQPQPNLVLNSDFGRRNKWMTFMPETFTDTSGWTAETGSLGTVGSNILTAGTVGDWRVTAAPGMVWRDARWSASFKAVDTTTAFSEYYVYKWISASNWVRVRASSNSNQLAIDKRINGVTTRDVVNGPTFGFTVNQWYWIELEAQGSTYIAKLYRTGTTAAGTAKASSTLDVTFSVTIADSLVAAGNTAIGTSGIGVVGQFGGLSSGDGGVYVEGWGPESLTVDYTLGGVAVAGGQAIGFDETASAGPIGKQWALRAYIPAATRAIDLRTANEGEPFSPSISYAESLYMKTSGLGGSGALIRTARIEYNDAGGTSVTTANILSDSGETSWTRKTGSFTTGANTVKTQFYLSFNYNRQTGGAGGMGSATGTAFVTLRQVEQGSTVTPWRNAPADEGPIIWELNVASNATAQFTNAGAYAEVESRDLAANVFLPWDSNVDMNFTGSWQNDSINGNNIATFYVDGTAVDSSRTLAMGDFVSATLNTNQPFNARYVQSNSAGKHRIAARAGVINTGTLKILLNAVAAGIPRRPHVIITATRGKFDLAEEYSVSDRSINAGDIVRLAPGSGSTTVEKTIGGYSQDILGIISTDPGITLGNYNSSDGSIIDGNYQSRYGQGNTLRPVALQGRVPVKVTSENGPIKRGDILTSSATLPGYAMKAIKAGRSIGVAMEPFGTDVPQDAGSSSLGSSLSPTVDSVTGLPVEEVKVGKVMTFVNLSFYDPQVYITDSGTLSVIKVGSTPVLLSSSSTGGVGGDITIDNSTTETKQSFTYQIQDRVTKEIIERIGAFNNLFVANLKVGSIDVDKIESKEIDQLKLSLTDLLTNQASLSGRIEFLENTASNSGVLGVLGSSTYTEGTPSASFNDLTIFNKLITTNLGVTGTIQSGLLSIEGINSLGNSAINTLNGDLYLQNNLLGGVNILSGKVTIDTKGNLKVQKLSIDTANAASRALGRGTILKGETSIVIPTTSVTKDSEIFVTAKTKTGKQPLIVGNVNPEIGFKVEIEEPYTEDITFSWWIVN